MAESFLKKAVVRRIVYFQLVALGGTVINMVVLWLLKGRFNLPVWIADPCGIELAIIHNFTWHYFWTWRERVRYTVRDYFIRFVEYNGVTAPIDFLVSVPILVVLTEYLDIYYLYAKPIGMVGGAIVKFFANEYLIFRKKKQSA
jgi:putative flippase GtrA